MDATTAEDLYQQLLEINEHTFQAGSYTSAYHILVAALLLAKELPNDEFLLNISQIAQEQLAWIDQNHPEYKYSTQSVLKNTHRMNLYQHLSSRAEYMVEVRRLLQRGNSDQESTTHHSL